MPVFMLLALPQAMKPLSLAQSVVSLLTVSKKKQAYQLVRRVRSKTRQIFHLYRFYSKDLNSFEEGKFPKTGLEWTFFEGCNV